MLNAPVPANATPLPKAPAYNRRAILKAAHFTAKWRKSTPGCQTPYRTLFAQSLAHEWKKAKADRLRRESNVGLPLRSCPADRPTGRRWLTRESGRLAHSFAS